MRGEMEGEIDKLYSTPVHAAVKMFGRTLSQDSGTVAFLTDAHNNVSMPFGMPQGDSQEVMQKIVARVDVCTSPYTVEKGLFRKRTYVTGCPALGKLAIQPPQLEYALFNRVRRSII